MGIGMATQRTTTNAHYNLNYHLVWIPKYRRKTLDGVVGERLEAILREIATEKELEIVGLEVMPDHIHLFVSSPPQHSPSLLVNWFKGISAKFYNDRFAKDGSGRIRWAHGYYAGSAGTVTSDTIKIYIEEQTRCRDTSVESQE